VAVYELHTQRVDLPVDRTAPWDSIQRGTLGLEVLHGLTTRGPLRKFHEVPTITVHEYHRDANTGGLYRAKFVRWAVDRILPPRLMSKIPRDLWAQHVLDALRDVAAELKRATKEIDDEVARKGLQHAVSIRSNDLFQLLGECLKYTEQYLKVQDEEELRRNPTEQRQKTDDDEKYRLGVDDLALIANDTDLVSCMQSDVHLRKEYYDLRKMRVPRNVCFRNMGRMVLKRLRHRGHSIPLDNAVRVMLRVIPRLDALTLETLPFQDWYETLLRHGLDTEAETFCTAMKNHPTLHKGAVTPKDKRSSSVKGATYMSSASEPGSTYLLPARDFTPRRRPFAENMVEDDDDDESSSVATTVRSSVKAGPSPSVPPAPIESTFPPKMPPKHSAFWQQFNGSTAPAWTSTGAQQSYPALQSSSTRDANMNPTSSKGDALSQTNSSASASNGAYPPRNIKTAAEKSAFNGNAVSAKDFDDQNTPPKATSNADEDIQVLTSPLFSSTPQRRHKKTSDATIGPENTTEIAHSNEEVDLGFDFNWRKHHHEYYSWPRALTIDHNIDLILPNDQRGALLNELSNAEFDRRLPFKDQLNDDQRETLYDDMLYDLKTIKQAVQAAKVKSHNSSATTEQAVHRTLRQVVDLIEGDEGFEGTFDEDGDSDMAEK